MTVAGMDGKYTDGFFRHIAFCTDYDSGQFIPFKIAGVTVGWTRRDTAQRLSVCEGFSLTESALALACEPDHFAQRTELLRGASLFLSEQNKVKLDGEIYPVVSTWGGEIFAQVDRVVIPWFGVRGFGVHVNGFVRKPDGIYLWIGKRASDRRVDPGKLDNMIGGGLPYGLTIEDNLRKEAMEEAGLAPDQVRTAKHVSTLSYKLAMMKGLRNDTLFVFDLELPDSVVPSNTDGEVEKFMLMPAKEVADIILETDQFKFNCNLVLIDFFLRHGLIDPDTLVAKELAAAMEPIRTTEGQTLTSS